MNILVNAKIKSLFYKILLIMLTCALICVCLAGLKAEHASVYISISFLGMTAAVLTVFIRYFKEQNEIMEEAVTKITQYISGTETARIECSQEGELYRLFHEVNSLVSILNAHAENERRAKLFLKDVISDISHQLKTPLAALNIYNGLLLEETQELPELKEFVLLSEKELDRMEALVQNLLKITKLDAGTVIFEKASENIADMMKETEMHFAYRAKQEHKEIILSGSDTAVLFCDRVWITEAVDNIVKNALDHTDSGGRIRIEWKQTDTLVQIAIHDNGSGIHPQDLYHIFKRFYRSRFSKDTQGIGLGLPLAKVIVEGHNGTIEADSQMGRGTVFMINFLEETGMEG